MIDKADLSEEDLDRFLGSKLFQKYHAYRKLTEGIRALKEDDVLYESLVNGVMRRQDRVRSQDSINDVVDALVAEVEDNTDFLSPQPEVEAVVDDE